MNILCDMYNKKTLVIILKDLDDEIVINVSSKSSFSLLFRTILRFEVAFYRFHFSLL